jgi:uncharacterized lipoprotein NlpE involved in copper resistance
MKSLRACFASGVILCLMGCGNQSNEDLTRRIEVLQAEHAALEATVDSIKTNLKSQTEVSQMLLELIKKSNGDQ